MLEDEHTGMRLASLRVTWTYDVSDDKPYPRTICVDVENIAKEVAVVPSLQVPIRGIHSDTGAEWAILDVRVIGPALVERNHARSHPVASLNWNLLYRGSAFDATVEDVLSHREFAPGWDGASLGVEPATVSVERVDGAN